MSRRQIRAAFRARLEDIPSEEMPVLGNTSAAPDENEYLKVRSGAEDRDDALQTQSKKYDRLYTVYVDVYVKTTDDDPEDRMDEIADAVELRLNNFEIILDGDTDGYETQYMGREQPIVSQVSDGENAEVAAGAIRLIFLARYEQ